MIKAIVCIDENWAIGKDNDLLFHLPADMKMFKETTQNKIVFCGYNTLLSFPGQKPLKNRSTICLCPAEIERDDCYCIHTFEEAVRLLKELGKTQDVFIIGGAMVYQSFLPYFDEVLVTKVYADGNGTVFFPNLDENPDFQRVLNGNIILDSGYTINFNTYKRHTDE